VSNWSISTDDKVKLTKCQNHHHHGGVFDTWTEWAKPQSERGLGAGQVLSQFGPRLCGHVSTREEEGQDSRSHSTWLAGHMLRPVGRHMVSYHLG
jgi:hypothetical protein